MGIDIEINAENFYGVRAPHFAELVAEVCEQNASVDFDAEVIKAILEQLDAKDLADVLAACGLQKKEA